jgi:hypothetical protein
MVWPGFSDARNKKRKQKSVTKFYTYLLSFVCICDLRGLLLISYLSYNEFINELVMKYEISQSRQ